MAARARTCKVCGHRGQHELFSVPEMMFGLGESFFYLQCRRCGCLQLENPPREPARYYPQSYYSVTQEPVSTEGNLLRRLALALRDRYALQGRGMVGRLLYRWFPIEGLRSLSRVVGLNRDSRILDVGCGTGALLYRLRERGFQHLLGVDPWLPGDIHYPNGLTVRRQTLAEVEGTWEVVMFHHSFEHLTDPEEALRQVSRLVTSGGTCLLRMPVVPCYAWERYGVHWVQIDAPRHQFIFSPQGIRILAKKTGWKVAGVAFDSSDFQFWGSEQYVRGIALTAPNSYALNPGASIFTGRQIRAFRAQARRLNAQGRGDSAAFYLVRAGREEE